MNEAGEFDPAVGEAFGTHFGYTEETMRLYQMTRVAFQMALFTQYGFEKVTELIEKQKKKMNVEVKWPFHPNKPADDLLKYVAEASKFNFPMLNAQAAVAIWAGIEAMVEDVLVALFVARPEGLNVQKVEKVKVSVSTFQAMIPEERVRYILRQLDMTEDPATSRNGVDAFEPILKVFDLSVPIEADTRTTLFQLSQIRNVIVHRMHKADARFVKACPQLGYKIGDQIVVKEDQVDSFFKASADYTVSFSKQIATKWPKKATPAAPATPTPPAPSDASDKTIGKSPGK